MEGRLYLPSLILAVRKCLIGHSICNRICDERPDRTTRPPAGRAERVLTPSPILPDEDGENRSHARLEHTEENSIHAKSGETSCCSRGSRRDPPEDLVYISEVVMRGLQQSKYSRSWRRSNNRWGASA